MRYPTALWYPGPSDKQGYAGIITNAGEGVVCHSMVGHLDGALARLEGPDRASWHFSVAQSGKVFQHYDSGAVCWHAGTLNWNSRTVGIEHEGGPPGDESEPLTDPQREASVALVRWLSLQYGFPMTRGVGLHEHNELGYATACPSGRIPWAAYTEDEDAMTPELKTTLDALYAAVLDQGKRLGQLQKAVPALAVANADSFQKIEERLKALEK